MQTHIQSTRWLTTDVPADLKCRMNSQGCEQGAGAVRVSVCLRVRKELERRVSRAGKESFSNGEDNIAFGREGYGRPDVDERSLDFMRKGVYPAYTFIRMVSHRSVQRSI